MKSILLILFLTPTFVLPQDDGPKAKWDPKSGQVEGPMPVGTVAVLRGRARRQPGEDGEKVLLTPDSPVFEGDIIHTQPKTYVKLKMIDNTIIDIGSNSKFSLMKFKFKSQQDRKSIYKLFKGKMRSLIVNKGKPGDLTYKTPHVSMGIRGTEFLANVGKGKGGGLSTKVAVLHGKVHMDLAPMGYSGNEFLLKSNHLFRSDQFNASKPANDSLIKLPAKTVRPLINKDPEKSEGKFLGNDTGSMLRSPSSTSSEGDNSGIGVKLRRKYSMTDPRDKKRTYQDLLTQMHKSKQKSRNMGYKNSYRKPAREKTPCQYRSRCVKEEAVSGITRCQKTAMVKYPANCDE